MNEQIDIAGRFINIGIVMACIFAYCIVGAVYSGIAKRVMGSHYVFVPNFVIWPIMIPIGIVALIYCFASGQKIRDL